MRNSIIAVALALNLAGCATGGIQMHRLPPQTPAADNAAAVKKAAELAAAAQTAQAAARNEREHPDEAPAPVTAADAPPPTTYDPWGRLNRFTYRFNARFDEAIFLPVADGYRWLPSPVRSGVHDFFQNLTEVDNVVNYILQWRLHYGARSLGRFVINTTLGIGGLFDVAAKFHLPYTPTGFGTTLAKYRMHPGPYLVIPLLGPSTLRESVGLLGDYGVEYGINLADLYRGDVSWGLGVANAIDRRANVDFRYYATGSPFEYENIRFLYVRKLLLEDAGLHPREKPRKRNDAVPAGQ